MKKILILAAVLISCTTAFSQTADQIFTDIKKSNDKVEYMEVTKDMMNILLSQAQDKSSKAMKDIENIKMMSLNDEGTIGEMRMMLPKLKKNGYEVMLDESEDGAQVTVYTLKKGKDVKELFMVLQENGECRLMLFKGKIDPNTIEQLMNFGDDDDE